LALFQQDRCSLIWPLAAFFPGTAGVHAPRVNHCPSLANQAPTPGWCAASFVQPCPTPRANRVAVFQQRRRRPRVPPSPSPSPRPSKCFPHRQTFLSPFPLSTSFSRRSRPWPFTTAKARDGRGAPRPRRAVPWPKSPGLAAGALLFVLGRPSALRCSGRGLTTFILLSARPGGGKLEVAAGRL